MGKDAAQIRMEFHSRLGQMARELAKELYPDGLPRGTKFSELETIAGALGDEMARQLIEINVQEQADDWPEEELGECPVCGGAARKAPDEPRVLVRRAVLGCATLGHRGMIEKVDQPSGGGYTLRQAARELVGMTGIRGHRERGKDALLAPAA